MKKIDLVEIWDKLNGLRCKQQYLNEVDMTWKEEIFKGNIDFHKDTLYGKSKLDMELEIEFEKILNQFEKIL